MSGCRFPEHHGSGGGGFNPVPLLVVLGAVALVSTPAVAAAIHAFLVAAGITAGVLLVVGAVFVVWRVRSLARPAERAPLGRGPARRDAIDYHDEARRDAIDYDNEARYWAWVDQPPARQGRPAVGGRRVIRAIKSPRDDVPTYPREHVDTHVVTRGAARPRRRELPGRWS